MITLSPQEAARALGGRAPVDPVRGVAIDSRRVASGDLFLAIRGETHDGHAFLSDAFASGASGAVVEAGRVPEGVPAERVYEVEDTRRALGLLAREVRRKAGAKVVGITGSVGKTGTKDLARAMAARSHRVVATEANENNEIGLPLTLLRQSEETEFVFAEMGMRGPGQIAELASYAEPDVAVVTNVAPVHVELLGDLEAIARAKLEILEGLPSSGTGVLPCGDARIDRLVTGVDVRLIRFAARPAQERGTEADVMVRYQPQGEAVAELEVTWPGGEAQVEVPWTARARMENAAAAVAACWVAGLDPVDGLRALPTASFSPLRGDEFMAGDVLVVDDSYNANPLAVRGAVDALVERAGARGGRPVAVLGDMLELGPEAPMYHREIGVHAARRGVALLVAVGELSKDTLAGFRSEAPRTARGAGREDPPSLHVSDAVSACAELDGLLEPGDVVLVKASRGLRLERVARHLAVAGDGLVARDRNR